MGGTLSLVPFILLCNDIVTQTSMEHISELRYLFASVGHVDANDLLCTYLYHETTSESLILETK